MPVNNPNNSQKPQKIRRFLSKPACQPVDKSVMRVRITQVRKDIEKLLTGCDPVLHNRIRQHLDTPSESDRMMLDAWRRCGKADYGRIPALQFSYAARRTFTALGVACLVAYGRAWLDAAEEYVG